jgi:hypothetical protein
LRLCGEHSRASVPHRNVGALCRPNAFMSIGNQIKLILGLPPKKLEFTTHSAAMKKNSSKSSATAVI